MGGSSPTVRRLHEDIDRQYFAHDPLANRRAGSTNQGLPPDRGLAGVAGFDPVDAVPSTGAGPCARHPDSAGMAGRCPTRRRLPSTGPPGDGAKSWARTNRPISTTTRAWGIICSSLSPSTWNPTSRRTRCSTPGTRSSARATRIWKNMARTAPGRKRSRAGNCLPGCGEKSELPGRTVKSTSGPARIQSATHFGKSRVIEPCLWVIVQPRNGSWTPPRVRAGGCLAR